MNKKTIVIFIFIIGTIINTYSEQNIIATNAWTKVFVNLAGSNAQQIASSSMKHPPEYELTPSDVIKIKKADYIVFAGYETMMKTVINNFKKPENKLIQIKTGYTPLIVKESVMKIAVKTGTEKIAKKNIDVYNLFFKQAVEKIKKNKLYGKSVIVQFHHKDIIKALGFKILAVEGPRPLEAGMLAKLVKLKPELIIDNAHNPMFKPLEEITSSKRVELINFPGFLLEDKTSSPESLEGILEYNINKIIRTQD